MSTMPLNREILSSMYTIVYDYMQGLIAQHVMNINLDSRCNVKLLHCVANYNIAANVAKLSSQIALISSVKHIFVTSMCLIDGNQALLGLQAKQGHQFNKLGHGPALDKHRCHRMCTACERIHQSTQSSMSRVWMIALYKYTFCEHLKSAVLQLVSLHRLNPALASEASSLVMKVRIAESYLKSSKSVFLPTT